MKTEYFGNPQSDTVLIQMVDERDLSIMDREIEIIRSLTADAGFLFASVCIGDWNSDLSPWPAAPAFGTEGFGSGAGNTLNRLLDKVVRPLRQEGKRFYLGGYSLAGLFALWAAYQTDAFRGIAAASPSVWFPSFLEYTQKNQLRTDAVYLSLGTKEEKTRNPIMARVGRNIRELHAYLEREGTFCTMEWNEGNHFREPELRMAKGFAWLVNRDREGERQ